MKNLLNILGIKLPKYRFKMSKEFKENRLLLYRETYFGNIIPAEDWRIGESWGNVQDNANCFFQLEGDEDNNTIHSPDHYGKVNLSVKPQEFFSNKINKQLHFKAGKIVSKNKFHYGIFKIRAKMPNFKYQWCAIWLCGKVQPDNKVWQEIDIVENYNHNKVKFASSNKIYSQPNVHYIDKQGKHKMTSPSSKYIKQPDSRYVDYILHWEEDFIRIYYDNYLVYECTDKFILNQFNEPMNLIINNAVEWGVELLKKDIEKISKADTNFCIRSVEYWSK